MRDVHAGHDHAERPAGTPSGQEFWDQRYASAPALWSGHVNDAFVAAVDGLTPGTALDVGAGEGGDALWLAERGWRVTAVDVSEVALGRLRARATELGVDLTAEHHDVLAWRPDGSYDLVFAAYLHLPTGERERAYEALAAAVAPGGSFVVVAHDRSDVGVVPRPPSPDLYVDADELAAALDPAHWEVAVAEARPRQVTHDGRDVTVHDVVLRAVRR